jgi:hypothetical protein
MSKKILTIMILTTILNFFGCKGKNEPEKTKQELEFEKFLSESTKSIEEFKNRKIYKKLTSQILDSIPDDKLEQTIIDNIYEIIGADYQNELNNLKKLTKGQQAVFSTMILEGEVDNGGFNQFYFNSSGQYAEIAGIGLKNIGAEKLSELTQRANKVYNENKERLEEFDDGTMESFSESYKENPLNDLDTKFYELSKLEKIADLRIKYIREHKSEFTTE